MAPPRLAAADLTALRLLVDTVDTGSVSAAARAARIAQPSASEALHRLERRLGLTLLVRTPQGSRPTPAAQRLVGLARQALTALDAVAAEAAALQAAERQEVRVAASYTIAEYVLPALLPGAGDLTVALSVVNSDEVLTRVRGHEADVGFIEGPLDVTGLRVRRIARDELVVVVAPRHPWARLDEPLPAATLARTPLLLREPESGTRRTYERALAGLGLTPAAPLGVLTSTEALKAAVRAEVGGTVLSRLAVAADVPAGTLVEVPVAGLDLGRDLRAVWLPGRLTPLAASFARATVSPGASDEAPVSSD
ncbi:LysR family transcriptional regulator [Planosporangium thailandense]|uniref:LysR family transcriptional regulator n=1 Tax=Planosporangium thailandense TaxID=765197 RepID=A0ABX0Y6U1_9ACTN|nr:LysR family transcriptional regulator [Planosporangium thailandense]NJC73145.1 LysR family transcriptional regulator [Planosporangium thailandense]